MGSQEDEAPKLKPGTRAPDADAARASGDDAGASLYGPPGLSAGPPGFPPPLAPPPGMAALERPLVPEPRAAPDRQDFVRQVADEVVLRADKHAADLVEDFVERGRVTMQVFQQEQVQRVADIRGKLDVCTESYTQLRRDNASLRTNLETIVRHIQMLHWTSPAAQWAMQTPQAGGMQGGMQGGMHGGMPYYQVPTQEEYSYSSEQAQPKTHSKSKGSPTKAAPKQNPKTFYGASGPTAADLRAGVGPATGLQFQVPERKATPTPALDPLEEGDEEDQEDIVEDREVEVQQATATFVSTDALAEESTAAPAAQMPDIEEEKLIQDDISAAIQLVAQEERDELEVRFDASSPSTPPRTYTAGAPPGLTPPNPAEEITRVSSEALAAHLREGGKPTSCHAFTPPKSAAKQTPSTAQPSTAAFSSPVGTLGAPSPAPSSPGSPFGLTLRRVDGMPLGLEVKPDQELGCLHIQAVREGSVAAAWNRQCENEHRLILKGDRVISVNGATEPEAMRSECISKLLLKIEVVREAADIVSQRKLSSELELVLDEP